MINLGDPNESITGIRVTQSFAREPENAQHFDDLNRSFFDANVDAAWLAVILFPGSIFWGRFRWRWWWAWVAGWLRATI